MPKFNEELGAWEGDVEPTKPRVWRPGRGVWETVDELPKKVSPPKVAKKKKVTKKKR